MRPRFEDLFDALRDVDQARADRAYDQILFERADAIPDLAECYIRARKDPHLRFLVVQLLGFTGSPRAIPHVLEALRDPDPTVRAEACRALEDLRAKDSVLALRERSEDLDAGVREAASEALDALATEPAAE